MFLIKDHRIVVITLVHVDIVKLAGKTRDVHGRKVWLEQKEAFPKGNTSLKMMIVPSIHEILDTKYIQDKHVV